MPSCSNLFSISLDSNTIIALLYMPYYDLIFFVCTLPGGGGGHSGTEGGRTFVTYFAEKGVFF